MAWPLDKFEGLSIDITRLSDMRKWGKDPTTLDTDRRGPSPLQSTEWNSPWKLILKLTGMGERRSVVGEPASKNIKPEYSSWKVGRNAVGMPSVCRRSPKTSKLHTLII